MKRVLCVAIAGAVLAGCASTHGLAPQASLRVASYPRITRTRRRGGIVVSYAMQSVRRERPSYGRSCCRRAALRTDTAARPEPAHAYDPCRLPRRLLRVSLRRRGPGNVGHRPGAPPSSFTAGLALGYLAYVAVHYATHHFDPNRGYQGALPARGEQPHPSNSLERMEHFSGTEMRDGIGHGFEMGDHEGGGHEGGGGGRR